MSVEVLKALVEATPDYVKRFNEHGQTALHLAVIIGDYDAAKYLIDIGADVNALDESNANPSVYICVEDGDDACCKMLRLLVDNGCNILAESRNCFPTCVSHIAMNQMEKCFELVMENTESIDPTTIYPRYTGTIGPAQKKAVALIAAFLLKQPLAYIDSDFMWYTCVAIVMYGLDPFMKVDVLMGIYSQLPVESVGVILSLIKGCESGEVSKLTKHLIELNPTVLFATDFLEDVCDDAHAKYYLERGAPFHKQLVKKSCITTS